MSAVPRPTPKPSKPYWEMTTEELAEATRAFDEPFVVDKSRPLTPEEQTHWEELQRRLRERKSEPRSRVSVLLPRSLIREIDVLAKHWRCSRANVIRLGLRQYLRHRRKKAST